MVDAYGDIGRTMIGEDLLVADHVRLPGYGFCNQMPIFSAFSIASSTSMPIATDDPLTRGYSVAREC
jgi:hypothetical protein